MTIENKLTVSSRSIRMLPASDVGGSWWCGIFIKGDNMNEYAHNDHWKWIEQIRKDLVISELGKTVANILGYIGYGIYNCPINYKKADWSNDTWIEIIWSRPLSNWDFDNLTRLILECHERLIRIDISGAAPNRLRMLFHQRESREGGMSVRMPTIEEMIERRKDAFRNE
ncbi:hypothetical protein LCGC14_2512820 [marine sediment metagenome]|uniref:Uncharacterized protein n=1 Tax=marine sediment metagenome TaxID=412755 RepID=A0A0F9DAG0_9ZZZZ